MARIVLDDNFESTKYNVGTTIGMGVVLKLLYTDVVLLAAMLCGCRLQTFLFCGYHVCTFFAFAGFTFQKQTLRLCAYFAMFGAIAIMFTYGCKKTSMFTYRQKYWIQRILTWLIQIISTLTADCVICFNIDGLWLLPVTPVNNDAKMKIFPVFFFSLPCILIVVQCTLPCCNNWRSKQSWKKRVKGADIAWIACGALRNWAACAEKRLIRRQGLQRTEYLLESEINSVWCKPRRFVVSHAWLSKRHPDPDGVHLHELVTELDQLHANDADVVFFDYSSLYQTDLSHPDATTLEDGDRLPAGHPALRTPEENEKFGNAMKMMHELYTFEESEVIILPNVPESAPNNIAYLARGWCFFEFAISTDHWRVINDKKSAVSGLLASTNAPMSDLAFVEEFQKKTFTCKGDAETVLSLYKHLYQNESGRNARAKWLQIGEHVALWILLYLLAAEWNL